jgi:hypothetical protein
MVRTTCVPAESPSSHVSLLPPVATCSYQPHSLECKHKGMVASSAGPSSQVCVDPYIITAYDQTLKTGSYGSQDSAAFAHGNYGQHMTSGAAQKVDKLGSTSIASDKARSLDYKTSTYTVPLLSELKTTAHRHSVRTSQKQDRTKLPAAGSLPSSTTEPGAGQPCVGLCVGTWNNCHIANSSAPQPCCSADDLCVELSPDLGQCHPHWHVVQAGLSDRVLCRSSHVSHDACDAADFVWWPPLTVHFAWTLTAKQQLLMYGGLSLLSLPGQRSARVQQSSCQNSSNNALKRTWTGVSDMYLVGTSIAFVRSRLLPPCSQDEHALPTRTWICRVVVHEQSQNNSVPACSAAALRSMAVAQAS